MGTNPPTKLLAAITQKTAIGIFFAIKTLNLIILAGFGSEKFLTLLHCTAGAHDSVVVEALGYKPEGREIESR
jgi:hypothetical protein